MQSFLTVLFVLLGVFVDALAGRALLLLFLLAETLEVVEVVILMIRARCYNASATM
jgi:hypothetical protein